MDYNAFRATAKRLIEGFGNNNTATITRRTRTGYDPITDTPTETVTTYTIECVMLTRGPDDLSTPTDRTLHDKQKVMVPATGLAITPAPGDEVALPGDPAPYVITDVMPTRPDGTYVYHQFYVQKAAA